MKNICMCPNPIRFFVVKWPEGSTRWKNEPTSMPVPVLPKVMTCARCGLEIDDSEPFYIRQAIVDENADFPKGRMAWAEDVVKEAQAEGAMFCRVSWHPDIEGLTLVEGWRKPPKEQGPQRWSFRIDGEVKS